MRKRLDKKWRFYPGGESPFFGVNNEGMEVNLPHDFSIIQKRNPDSKGGAANAFFPGGLGCYKKSIYIPEDWKGKDVLLEFEGIYMNAEIRFNKQLVARHIYGYTGFFVNLTPCVRYNAENEISVNVNNDTLPNSRWYSGSGIYRHVWLEVRDPVHIAPWGVYVTTPVVSPLHSVVQTETTLENGLSQKVTVTLRSRLIDKSGAQVTSTENRIDLPANGKSEVKQLLDVGHTHLWSVDNPYLYILKSEIIQNNAVIDEKLTSVGIRTLSFDAKQGFRLNGKIVKLKGACVHHDCGLLGSAAYDRAEERKVELLKANGFNAIRCAHNPPSPAFLDACDRLGILVIDEAFDCWREAKNPNDYGVFFDMCWENDLSSMLLRDRNHPCIIMWSTGNEILERDGRSDGYRLAKDLADFVRLFDKTRAVTNALCPIPGINDKVDQESLVHNGDQWGELTEKFIEPLDVAGYNYLRHRYEYDGEKYPNRIICGTESYPSQVFENWEQVQKNPHVIGDFVWTGIDYLGESGIGRVWYGERKSYLGEYPWHTAFCGDFDICGFKRPQSYYRDCVWGISKAPYIAVYNPEHYGQSVGGTPWSWPDVVSSWDWPGFEGKPVAVEVYCVDDEVELFLNGKSLGRKAAGKENKYKVLYETVYEKGELVAVGYADGNITAKTVLKTAKNPVGIRLTPDREILDRGEGDLSYVTVEIVDEDGNIAVTDERDIFFAVCGPGSLLAVGNSNPVSEEMYVGNHRRAYRGRAMAVVRSEGFPGEITLEAMADGLPVATVSIYSAGSFE